MRTPAIAALKSETGALHAVLDGETLIRHLMATSLQPATYADILARMFLAWSVCERLLAAGQEAQIGRPQWFDLQHYHLSDFLLADLESLAPDQVEEIQALCRRTPVPLSLCSEEQVVGVCYVLMGSRLGARSILRTLESADPQIVGATRFFRASVENSAQLWTSFCQAVGEQITFQPQIHEASQTARRVFEFWIAAMSGGNLCVAGMSSGDASRLLAPSAR